MIASLEACPVCSGTPRVLVALRHPVMRHFTLELLARDHGCWTAVPLGDQDLRKAMQAEEPDLVVLDASTFHSYRCPASCGFPCARMIVVGPEPDQAYQSAVLGDGAGGWVARDDIAEQLSGAMRAALGCTHGICPPAGARHRSVPARSTVP